MTKKKKRTNERKAKTDRREKGKRSEMWTEQEEDESYVSARHTNTFLCWHEEKVQDSDVTEGARERESW